MNVKHTFEIINKRVYLPFPQATIAAGFPSPAFGYEEDRLDINDIVVTNPAATFYIRVKGNSMIGANIVEGYILVVDRSLEPRYNDIMVAIVDGENKLICIMHDITIKIARY
ncbi:MAG: S24 family peptidase [Burkholderiales bacterium]